jgi:divalent metal cation (Fe/Co/Zn/Cd) transporter
MIVGPTTDALSGADIPSNEPFRLSVYVAQSVENQSRLAIIAAIAGNIAIAVTKFIAAGLTGSSAMLSEGINSLLIPENGGLMLLGIHKSQQAPDFEHPFGHGKELYFWDLHGLQYGP